MTWLCIYWPWLSILSNCVLSVLCVGLSVNTLNNLGYTYFISKFTRPLLLSKVTIQNLSSCWHKAGFHYSSKLQTWSQTCVSMSQAGRKHIENVLHQSRHVEIDAAGSRPGFRQKSRKLVESMSQTRTNLSKTWLQTWSKTRFAARFAAG